MSAIKCSGARRPTVPRHDGLASCRVGGRGLRSFLHGAGAMALPATRRCRPGPGRQNPTSGDHGAADHTTAYAAGRPASAPAPAPGATTTPAPHQPGLLHRQPRQHRIRPPLPLMRTMQRRKPLDPGGALQGTARPHQLSDPPERCGVPTYLSGDLAESSLLCGSQVGRERACEVGLDHTSASVRHVGAGHAPWQRRSRGW